MKILFIDNFKNISPDSITFSCGLLTLGTILDKKGCNIEIVNFEYLFTVKTLPYNNIPMENFETMADYILSKSPHIVGFTTMCNSFHNSLILAQYIKNRNSKIKIIFGGPQASIFPERILEVCPWIDLICPGEAEDKVEHIIEGIQSGDLGAVPGIVYRKENLIITNENKDTIIDLDSLPVLNYELIPYFQEYPFISLEIGRGCPFNCIYCSTSEYWKRKFRHKSKERILKEISFIKEIRRDNNFNINFIHDNFTVDRKYVMDLCEGLKDINWTCSARLDNLDEELVKNMYQAGCREIYMGIETGSQKMQYYIRKNLKLEKLDGMLDILMKSGIQPSVSFMYGFPEEKDEDLILTLDMIHSMLKKGVYNCQIHSLCILNGSQLFKNYKDKLTFKECYSDFAVPSNLDLCNSLIREHKELFSHFYILGDSTVEKYPFLDRFVFYIFIYLYRYFTKTFHLIMETCENNILNFYKDFIINTDNNFIDFFTRGEDLKDFVQVEEVLLTVISFLEKYINKKLLTDEKFKPIFDAFNTDNVNFMIELSS